jgi:alpha-tubulin suppressor-like RCC1 family protein
MAIKIQNTTVINDSRVITNIGQPFSIAQGGTNLTSPGNAGNILVSDGNQFVSIALGTTVAIAYAWGNNGSGRLGDNTTTSRLQPNAVVGGITNWQQLSAGRYHSLGVTQAGIAYAWGVNGNGQLGINLGITANRSSPVTVAGGITNWQQLSAGGAHSLGVTQGGIAYAWGANGFGNLGDNTITERSSPVTVVGGITNWQQLSAGDNYSLGVTQGGIAYAWGSNSSGRLGDNTVTSRRSPVTVVGGITNWQQLSAGTDHSLGVTQGGIAYAWGSNSSGRLGDNTATSRSSPVTVVGGITNWQQLSAGRYHSLGVTQAGIAYAWGFNDSGRLGDNTLTTRSSPVTVVGGITNWQQLSAGRYHSLGVTQGGIAYAWGFNGSGRLGDGTTTNRSSPVSVIGGITTWQQLSAGDTHSLGATAIYDVINKYKIAFNE